MCPNLFGQITLASPWNRATNGSPDYFHRCGVNNVGVPSNFAGYQEPRTGDAYAGEVILYSGPSDYREYIYSPLSSPLLPGLPYQVGFWVVMSNLYPCPSGEFGAYFSVDIPPSGGGSYDGVMNVDPQFEATVDFVTDSAEWVLISGCFIAEGGEQYITIGNFTPVGYSPVHPDCIATGNGISYYLIEDVFVMPLSVEELVIELGDTVTSCFEYILDPGIPEVNYYWSTGSTEPSIVVTSTGLYAVTIIDGCKIGTDSIYVIIPAEQQVELGPPMFDMCEWDVLEIHLDPQYDYTWQDGSTSADYSIHTEGSYAVTMFDGCYFSSDEILVQIVEPPPPFALDDNPFICADEEILFWFDPDIGNFLWQDGSIDNEYYVSQPGEYALTISNICGSESSFVELIGLAAPTVDVGPDTLLCPGDTLDIYLLSDPLYHDFEWSTSATGPQIFISSSGMYSVTVTNTCGQVADTLEIGYTTPPLFSLGVDTSLCSSQQSILIEPENFINATYVWQDSTTSDSFLVTQPGTYFVTISNQCGEHSDTIQVHQLPNVESVDLGADRALCPGEQIVVMISDPNAAFLWQDGSTLDSFVIQSPGEYFVQAYNDCSSSSDTIQVVANNNPPIVDLPTSLVLCQGNSLTLDANISGVNYIWNDGSAGSTLAVSTPGTYSVTVSNSCGVDQDTVIIADGGPAPMVDLGSDVSICPGDVLLISPTFSSVDTWLWNDGSTNPTISVISGGTIDVQVSNSCGTSYDTIQVNQLPATPPLDLGQDVAFCPGENVVLTITTPNVDIVWSDGSQNPTLTITQAGQYYATISNACGQNADTIQATILPPPPTVNLGIDQSLCPGELITLSPGIINVDYEWQDGSTGNSYTTTMPGTVILIVSNSCGSGTDTMEIIENTDGPMLNLGPDITGCVGETYTIQSGISGVSYLWNDGSTQPNYTATTSGAVILQVSNNCGMDTDTVLVDVSGVPPSTVLGPDADLCEGEQLTLMASTDPGTTHTWQDGSGTLTYVVTTSGMYILNESNFCGTHSDTLIAVFTSAPAQFVLGQDTVLCPGQSVILTAPMTTDEIMWQDGSNNSTFTADTTGTYNLTISNECGDAYDEMNVAIDTNVPELNLDTDIVLCQGDVIELDVTQSFPAQYMWNTGQQSSTIQITNTGIYSVTVSTLCASETGETDIHTEPDCFPSIQFYLPNVFSPDDNQVNDVFRLEVSEDVELTSVKGSIYDRWGNQVFTSQAIPFEWNGRFKNELLNPGAYVYNVQVEYVVEGKTYKEILTGDVTLVR